MRGGWLYVSLTHHIGRNITGSQPQTPGLYCRDADGLEEYHVATHLLHLGPTDWWILFDIQVGSDILALLV